MSSQRSVLKRLEEALKRSGTDSAELEARRILEAATGRSRTELQMGASITAEAEERSDRLAARRVAGEPLQYVLEVAGFRHLEIAVGPGVFIPRPETELVAETAMERLPEGGMLVDIGTGSGAIALSVADERPDARVLATESSSEALSWAQKNRAALDLSVELLHCDLFEGLPTDLAGQIDVVVSNPPYIDSAKAQMLPPEVVDHEPSSALFAAERGLEVMIRVADTALSWLKPGGWLVLEIGSDQAQAVLALLGAAGYENVSVGHDLAGRDRIAEAQQP